MDSLRETTYGVVLFWTIPILVKRRLRIHERRYYEALRGLSDLV
jgi:hypothetical protein